MPGPNGIDVAVALGPSGTVYLAACAEPPSAMGMHMRLTRPLLTHATITAKEQKTAETQLYDSRAAMAGPGEFLGDVQRGTSGSGRPGEGRCRASY